MKDEAIYYWATYRRGHANLNNSTIIMFNRGEDAF